MVRRFEVLVVSLESQSGIDKVPSLVRVNDICNASLLLDSYTNVKAFCTDLRRKTSATGRTTKQAAHVVAGRSRSHSVSSHRSSHKRRFTFGENFSVTMPPKPAKKQDVGVEALAGLGSKKKVRLRSQLRYWYR